MVKDEQLMVLVWMNIMIIYDYGHWKDLVMMIIKQKNLQLQSMAPEE